MNSTLNEVVRYLGSLMGGKWIDDDDVGATVVALEEVHESDFCVESRVHRALSS